MSGWRQRTSELRAELAALAEPDPRWWLLAGGAAVTERWPPRTGAYIQSDAEAATDTFIGHVAPAAEPIARALARAHAARAALRELDGELPEQPLAVTIQRDALGARTVGSGLDVIAVAIGARAWWAPLALGEAALAAELGVACAGGVPTRLRAVGDGPTPFVCVSLGDEPIATARHGHRRGWERGVRARGPWLGLGRSGELEVVSTCHMVVDGYGHAWLAARIAALAPPPLAVAPSAPAPPPLAPPPEAQPLGVAWRPLPAPAPRVLPLTYAAGRALHRATGRPAARFSPSMQVPVAPGRDAVRLLRRPVPAAVSVRFAGGEPEPFAAFDARARDVLAREANGRGLIARLLAAGRAAPTPLAWKRRAIASARPPWLERFADVIGGRGCISRIVLAPGVPSPAACAVSAPARMATSRDPLGSCVITVVDDGERAAITACGAGELAGSPGAAAALLDEILGLL